MAGIESFTGRSHNLISNPKKLGAELMALLAIVVGCGGDDDSQSIQKCGKGWKGAPVVDNPAATLTEFTEEKIDLVIDAGSPHNAGRTIEIGLALKAAYPDSSPSEITEIAEGYKDLVRDVASGGKDSSKDDSEPLDTSDILASPLETMCIQEKANGKEQVILSPDGVNIKKALDRAGHKVKIK